MNDRTKKIIVMTIIFILFVLLMFCIMKSLKEYGEARSKINCFDTYFDIYIDSKDSMQLCPDKECEDYFESRINRSVDYMEICLEDKEDAKV